MLVAAAFLALYMSLISQPHLPYFRALGHCARLTYLILVFPYAIITLSLYLASRSEDEEMKQDRMLRFTDENKKLKLVIAASSVVYAAAEENYVRVHYLEGVRLKDYVLRNSMKAVESLVEGKGLMRCHRSYIINPSHVKALSKGKEGLIEAEMDVDCPPIPVSKRFYDDLSTLL
jgi:DNA-binding LytR/AlgR family response regulator